MGVGFGRGAFVVSTYDIVVNVDDVEVTVTGTFFVGVVGRRVTFVLFLFTIVLDTGFLFTGLEVVAGFCVVLIEDTFTGLVGLLGGIEEEGFCVEFVTLLAS